jgi:hypothetical protein
VVVENLSFCVFSFASMKRVLRLAVRGISISGRIVANHDVPVFEGHGLPSPGSRWDIRWVSDRGFTWFLVYLASRL